MSAPSMTDEMMQQTTSYNRLRLDNLKAQLLSPDETIRTIAAARIRAAQDVKDAARASHTPVVVSRNGKVLELHPDSPLLPDYSELLSLADQLVPVSAGRTIESLTATSPD